MKRLFQHSNDWFFSITLASILVLLRPLKCVVQYFGDLIYNGLGGYLYYAVDLVFLAVIIAPAILRTKISIDAVLAFLFVFISWIISFLFNSEYSDVYIREGFYTFVLAFPLYCFSRYRLDYQMLKRVMYKLASISTYLMLARTAVGIPLNNLFEKGFTYDWTSSWLVAPLCVINIVALIDTKRLYYLIGTVISVGMLAFYGSRSPFLHIMIALLVIIANKMIHVNDSEDIRITGTKVVATFLAVIAMVVMVFIPGLIGIDQSYSNKPGFRVLFRISNGSFLRDESRMVLWKGALNYISDHPFRGTGLVRDRLVLSAIPYVKSYYSQRVNLAADWDGMYAHNFILETLMQYGALMGMIICVLIILAVIILVVDSSCDKSFVVAIVIAESLGQMLISGPTFRITWFWVLMGMGVGTFCISRRKLINE